jgi:hypothetical protein
MEKLAAALRKGRVDASSLTTFTVGKHQITYLTVHGTDAIPTWKRLRELVPETSCWPVLLGPDKELGYLKENLEDSRGQTPAMILRKARRVNVPSLFDQWQQIAVENAQAGLKEYRGDAESEAHFQAMLDAPPLFQGMPRGPWPTGNRAVSEFSIPYDVLTKEPHRRVHIALVPTLNGWEAPAFLMLGSWNACPHPHHHVAIMKDWHKRYGAEVVGITHDIVEMFVARPPRNREQALALAREQYLYCDDIVRQGVGTLEVLAATLRGGKSWYFWWD